MTNADQIAQMNTDELRAFTAQLMSEIGDVRRDNTWKQLKIDQLTHEMALMKRRKFGASSEQLKSEQRHLFEETVEADLEAMALELKALQRTETKVTPKETPKRAPLPLSLPRMEVRHEPESTLCVCMRSANPVIAKKPTVGLSPGQ